MNAKLFVRNLSWSVTEDDLYHLFSEAGGVLSVVIPVRREDGKPRGFAFVEMASAEVAQKAIQKFQGYMLAGRDLVVDFQEEGKGNRPTRTGSSPRNAKLFIRNVSYTVSQSDLENLFEQIGTVLSVNIPIDKETGQQKGFAFIEMSSADDAEQAIKTLNSTPLNGKDIIIDYQDPNRSRSKPRPNSGYGQFQAGGYSRQW